MLELAETVQDVVGNHPGIEFHPRPTDDPTVRRPDTSKAERVLGWKAQVTLRGLGGLCPGSRNSSATDVPARLGHIRHDLVELSEWWLAEIEEDPAYATVVTPMLLDVVRPEPGRTYLDLGCGEGR